MSNRQPDTKIVLKSKAGQTITLAAFWTDGERPSGGLDRRIKRMKIEWEDRDGELHTETVINNGKESTHYCNLWSGPPPERGSHSASRSTGPAHASKRTEDLGDDPLGDDSIPF